MHDLVIRHGTVIDGTGGAPIEADIAIANGKIAAQGTPDDVRSSRDPLVRQFVTAAPDGPVQFHYPGASVEDDFGVEARP